MNWKEILSVHGTCDKEQGKQRLSKLGDELFERWDFINGPRGATINDTEYFVTGKKKSDYPKVLISSIYLSAGCEPDKMNRAAYVKAVNQMFHEHRHTVQRAAAFSEDTADDGLEGIIRRQFVAVFYNSAYENNYINDPSEIDAILYSLKKSLDYFEDDSIVSKKEAGDILFRYFTADSSKLKPLLEPYSPQTIEDLIGAYEDINKASCDMVYNLDPSMLTDRWDMTDDLMFEPSHSGSLFAFENADTGWEQDMILEENIILQYPEVIDRIPRLRKELEAIWDQIDWDALDYDEMSYIEDFAEAIQSLEDEKSPTL